MGETAIAKRGYKSVQECRSGVVGVGQMSEVRDDPKLPSEIDIKLHAAMSSRSRDRARSVDTTVMRYPFVARDLRRIRTFQ